MDSDYVLLCGIIWCGYAQEEACHELVRAVGSANPDIGALAWAMLMKGMAQFKEGAYMALLKERFGLGTADTGSEL